MSRPLVLRWGRSAYETDESLALEESVAHKLGLDWALAPHDEPPDILPKAAILVVNSGVQVRGSALAAFGGDLILATTSGTDHIDVDGATARGLRVARTPDARRDAVVEHALAMALALTRALDPQVQASRAGRWARGDLPALAPRALFGSTALIVGLGVIGRRMAEVLRALGVEVLGVDPLGVPDGVRAVALEDGLARAQLVTLHCELSPSSRGLLSREALTRCNPASILINTARGGVLDTREAVEAVRGGRLGGLGVDVFAREPWPEIAENHPRILFTPHAAGYTADLGARVAREVEAALSAWVRGAAIPHLIGDTPAPRSRG